MKRGWSMIKFYWYEKCSTCKKAKAWLDQHDVAYELLDLIGDTPSKDQFMAWMDQNDYPISRYFNTSGIIYRTENLKEVIYDISEDKAAEMLSARGMLVKRPIIDNNGKIFLGFKESEYETLL